jgi:hypothetical protein
MRCPDCGTWALFAFVRCGKCGWEDPETPGKLKLDRTEEAHSTDPEGQNTGRKRNVRSWSIWANPLWYVNALVLAALGGVGSYRSPSGEIDLDSLPFMTGAILANLGIGALIPALILRSKSNAKYRPQFPFWVFVGTLFVVLLQWIGRWGDAARL